MRLVIFTYFIFLTGCSSVINQSVELIDVKKLEPKQEKYKYALVHSRTKIFNEGVHSIPFIPYPHVDRDWIYFNNIKGKQCSPNIAFSLYDGKFDAPWLKEIKGCVVINNDSYKIDIYFRKFIDGKYVEGEWDPYRFNGVYQAPKPNKSLKQDK
jgi:hypothetical protein